MISIYDVYKYYKRAEVMYKNKPYKEPKNIEKSLNRLSDENKEIIQTLSDYFNTKWYSINPELYFLSGFRLWKSFSWSMALRREVIKKYISSDKTYKRKPYTAHESTEYIKRKYGDIKTYCELKDGKISQPVVDYMRSTISGLLLYYLIDKGYLKLTEQDSLYIMYIDDDKYKELSQSIKGV